MTTSSAHTAAGGATATTDIVRRALEIALTVTVAAAIAGAWLAYFTFVPFDLRVH